MCKTNFFNYFAGFLEIILCLSREANHNIGCEVEIRNLAENNKKKYRSSFIGKSQDVLVEKINSKGIASGYGEHYIPVKFKSDKETSLKDFRIVEIIDIEDKEDPSILATPNNNL